MTHNSLIRIQKVLVIQYSRMGDLVQSLPLLKRLKIACADIQITLLCVKEYVPLIQNSTLIDRTIALPVKEFITVMQPAKAGKPQNIDLLLKTPELNETYDIGINLTHTSGTGYLLSHVNAWVKYGRIDYFDGDLHLLGLWPKYLMASLSARKENPFNIVDIYAGFSPLGHQPALLTLAVDDTDRKNALMLLKANGYRQSCHTIAFQMSASQSHRAWPLKQFAQLAKKLLEYPNIQIVLIGGKTEVESTTRFCEMIKTEMINLVGKTELADLPAVLKQCDLLISNDSGPMHIAAAVATPVVGLFFATAFYAETAPYGNNHVVLQVEIDCSPCHRDTVCKNQICIDFLPVEAVFEIAIQRLFDQPVQLSKDYPNLFGYKTCFLENCTLGYKPVNKKISPMFETGLIGRVAWEPVLGLKQDLNYIKQMIGRWPETSDFAASLKKHGSDYQNLAAIFQAGINLLNDISNGCDSTSDIPNELPILAHIIKKTEWDVEQCKNAPELFRAFHTLVIQLGRDKKDPGPDKTCSKENSSTQIEMVKEKYGCLLEMLTLFDTTLKHVCDSEFILD